MRLTQMTIFAGLLLCNTIAAGAESPQANVTPRQGREPSPAVINPAIRSPFRETVSLNGTWDFCTDPKLQGESAGWYLPGKVLPSARLLQVPGCWEAQGVGEPGLSSANNKLVYEPTNVKLRAAYTGAAWYKKAMVIPASWAGKQIWLKLGGVNAQGWIWVNGTFVAHDWAYCGTWKYNVTNLVAPGGKATIAVLVRNDVASRRGESNCVRMYGGLLRGVELEATPAVFIDNAFVEPLFDQKKARLHVTLRNSTSAVPNDAIYAASQRCHRRRQSFRRRGNRSRIGGRRCNDRVDHGRESGSLPTVVAREPFSLQSRIGAEAGRESRSMAGSSVSA